MRAGSLNRPIDIKRRSATVDAVGQPLETWSTVASVWSDIRNLNGLEAIRGGAETSIVRCSIRIRYRDDIDAGMRVYDDAGAVFDINAVLPHGMEYLDLLAERVAA